MKLPVAPIQRIVLGVAGAALVAGSLSAVAIVTQPASAESTQTEMTLVEPASDEPTTTTTTDGPTLVTIAAQVLGAPERAEKAAERAEVAATRSEVAAVKAETVVTSTTMPPTTSSTTIMRPILVDVTPPTMPTTTTTTTTLPKRWVEILRIKTRAPSGPISTPTVIPIELATGELRISNPQLSYWSSPSEHSGPAALWVGDSSTPPDGACFISTAWDTPPDLCSLPAGTQTLYLGREATDRDGTRWRAFGDNGRDLIIEEYR